MSKVAAESLALPLCLRVFSAVTLCGFEKPWMNHWKYHMCGFIKTRKPLGLAVLPFYCHLASLCFVSGGGEKRNTPNSKSNLCTIAQAYYAALR